MTAEHDIQALLPCLDPLIVVMSPTATTMLHQLVMFVISKVVEKDKQGGSKATQRCDFS